MPPTERRRRPGAPLLERLGGMREASMIWIALVVLVVVCALFEPSTLKGSAILSMLPFAAILAIAAVGQCLVIQQGGIDFSVVGSITLSAVIVCGHAGGDGGNCSRRS